MSKEVRPMKTAYKAAEAPSGSHQSQRAARTRVRCSARGRAVISTAVVSKASNGSDEAAARQRTTPPYEHVALRVAGGRSIRSMPDRDTDVLQAGERRSGRIESLRAAAALAVLGGHALLAGGGYGHGFSRTLATAGSLGVFLFFALTG